MPITLNEYEEKVRHFDLDKEIEISDLPIIQNTKFIEFGSTDSFRYHNTIYQLSNLNFQVIYLHIIRNNFAAKPNTEHKYLFVFTFPQ